MKITRVKVSNFKSFDELDIELRDLNIVIGANASGKSNFLEIFRFHRDVSKDGLENAVSIQGGMEYLANVRAGADVPVSLVLSSGDLFWPQCLARSSEAPWFRQLKYQFFADKDQFAKLSHGLDLAIFDFDPKLPKKAAPLTGKADLDPDGNNLAIVLRAILQDEERRKRLTLLVQDLLPFITDLKVDRFADKSLVISAKESFSRESYLPASFLSDGTIHLTALVLALYFDKAPIVIIEEPERHLHPHLISKVAAMLADASKQKQVIVTTHNPELVKHARLEDLLLVHRDADGFSRIIRPAENEQLKAFLENDLGVEDLYVQDLLGIGG